MITVGMAGLGTAGRAFVPAFAEHPGMQIVAAADPEAAVRDAFAAAHGVAVYDGLEAMLGHPGMAAVYIATPTPLHARQVAAALAAGKHVICEKPMAESLADAEAMVAAAARTDRLLLVGHSHSFDLPVQRMRALIDSGELGRVRMINSWCFSDWVYRPRRPDELNAASGGGVTFRQGSHQFDIIRLLGGGEVARVRGHTYDWDPARPATGAHSVMLEFANGTTGTAIYNGYGGLPVSELCGGVTEWGFDEAPGARPARRASGGADELAAKKARAGSAAGNKTGAPHQPHFGLTVVSCERGDIRQSPQGLLVYTAEGRREIALPLGITPHALVVAEFHDAITGRAPLLHDGRWGLANLEICAAAMQSSATGEAVALRHQIAVPRLA